MAFNAIPSMVIQSLAVIGFCRASAVPNGNA
jgi:hypothetical protein